MQAGPEKKFKMFEEGVVDRPPPLFDPRARRSALPPAGVAAEALETRATCVPRALAACASASHSRTCSRAAGLVSPASRAEIRPVGADADATSDASRWLKGRMNGWNGTRRDVCLPL
jgi:hypothetical protein